MVSSAWLLALSSGRVTAAMPPWAQRLEERRPVLRFSSNTRNPAGRSRQVIRPAAPAPITTTSQGPGGIGSSGRGWAIEAKKPPGSPTVQTITAGLCWEFVLRGCFSGTDRR